MLTTFADVLAEARIDGSAVGAFTCYDLETAEAVLDAAERRNRPVVILVSPSSVRGSRGDAFLAALLAYAEHSSACTCIEVDHADDLDLIERVLELGVGAVMADGSRLSVEENVAFVREAVSLASPRRAAVEAELGRVEGDEDLALAARQGRLTEPAEARRFVADSGATCLAVSIGNAHGRYSVPPQLDWRRLEEIRSQVDVPLALHGASGLSAADVDRCIRLGITKVNVNTELREAYLTATATTLAEAHRTAAVVDLHSAQVRAVAEVVAAKLDLYDRKEGGNTAQEPD